MTDVKEQEPPKDPMILAQYADARADETVVAAQKAGRSVTPKEAISVLDDYEKAEQGLLAVDGADKTNFVQAILLHNAASFLERAGCNGCDIAAGAAFGLSAARLGHPDRYSAPQAPVSKPTPKTRKVKRKRRVKRSKNPNRKQKQKSLKPKEWPIDARRKHFEALRDSGMAWSRSPEQIAFLPTIPLVYESAAVMLLGATQGIAPEPAARKLNQTSISPTGGSSSPEVPLTAMGMGQQIASGRASARGLGLPAGASTGGSQDWHVLAITGTALQRAGRCDMALPRLRLALSALGVSARSAAAWASWAACVTSVTSREPQQWASLKRAGLLGDGPGGGANGTLASDAESKQRAEVTAARIVDAVATGIVEVAAGRRSMDDFEARRLRSLQELGSLSTAGQVGTSGEDGSGGDSGVDEEEKHLEEAWSLLSQAAHGGDASRAGGGDRQDRSRLGRGPSVMSQVMRKRGLETAGFADEDEGDFDEDEDEGDKDGEASRDGGKKNKAGTRGKQQGNKSSKRARTRTKRLAMEGARSVLLAAANEVRSRAPMAAAALFAAHIRALGEGAAGAGAGAGGAGGAGGLGQGWGETSARVSVPGCQGGSSPLASARIPGVQQLLEGGLLPALVRLSESSSDAGWHGARGSAYELGRALREAGDACGEAGAVVGPLVTAGIWPSVWQRPALLVDTRGERVPKAGSREQWAPGAPWPLDAIEQAGEIGVRGNVGPRVEGSRPNGFGAAQGLADAIGSGAAQGDAHHGSVDWEDCQTGTAPDSSYCGWLETMEEGTADRFKGLRAFVTHLEAEFRSPGAPSKQEALQRTLKEELRHGAELGQGVLEGPKQARQQALKERGHYRLLQREDQEGLAAGGAWRQLVIRRDGRVAMGKVRRGAESNLAGMFTAQVASAAGIVGLDGEQYVPNHEMVVATARDWLKVADEGRPRKAHPKKWLPRLWQAIKELFDPPVDSQEGGPSGGKAAAPSPWRGLAHDLPLGSVEVSSLPPGARVRTHAGPSNHRWRLHLGVQVPSARRSGSGGGTNGSALLLKEGWPGVPAIRVGDRWRAWEEGSAFVFDDSFEHEVRLPRRAEPSQEKDRLAAQVRGDGWRTVLIVDVWAPWLDEAGRERVRQQLGWSRSGKKNSKKRSKERT